ncbi:Protein CNGC15c [Bienertia sinuspersici]
MANNGYTKINCCESKIISRVFSEDYKNIRNKILDPQSPASCHWNKIFLAASLLSIFIDPLFLFSPYSTPDLCVRVSDNMFDVVLSVLRSLLDVFYIINIVIQFRTAYIAPSSRVLGRGELVIDPSKISLRYLSRDFWIDLIAALPVPQVIIWIVIPRVKVSLTALGKTAPRFCILFQFLLRVVGGCYYLLSLQRLEACWRNKCDQENLACKYAFFDCTNTNDDPKRSMWLSSTNITQLCDANSDFYHFGIYILALQVGATSAPFLRKYFYCFWWALQSMSSIGNNLDTSGEVVENIYTNLVAILGVILFATLIGNLQIYIRSSIERLDEWRIKRADTERWMHHRQLSPELRQSVRSYDEYKWVTTRGVVEESLVKDLPPNLRRKVNRHLWFNLLRQVPLFDQMEDNMLDAICLRLKPVLSIKGAVLLREGEPVTKMYLIIRGNLDSHTTSGGQAGFFNSSCLGPGSFCGEELLTWVLDPNSTVVLPASTRTVKANSKVEALVLAPEDLGYVASQYKKLHSRKVVHNFRFHSHQWRTWAACYIQKAWQRYKRRKNLAEDMNDEMGIFLPQPGSGLATYAAELVRCIRRGSSNRFGPDSCTIRIQDDGKSELPVCISETRNLKVKCKISDRKGQAEAQVSGNVLQKYETKLEWLVLDPRGSFALRWKISFFIASMISLFVDPVFFLLPEVRLDFCIQLGAPLKVILSVIRSGFDFFYMINILVQFRMAYVAPSSRVIGRGELVFIWVILPNLKGSSISRFRTYVFILMIQMLQMLLRFFLAYPLSLQLCKASGVITEKAWLGAAYTLLFYLFASVVSGNCWYILSIHRLKQCWDMVCNQENACVENYLECSALGDPSRADWLHSSSITKVCDPDNGLYPFGIYSFTVTESLSTGGFFNNSQGQNLETSIEVAENLFSLLVATLGVSLFVLVIGIMQKYIQSANVRMEKWRHKQTDMEQWMHHRKLPRELRQSITEYYNFKWVATQGVDEAAILNALPINLMRQTKQYLCLNLVRQVPLFDELNDETLNAICERLKPTLYTQDMYLVCEGEPVNEMFFIMRGHLYSYTTDGGRVGFFNSSKLGPNGFCGEELLTWVLDRHESSTLPRSTRTVKAKSDVEGFVLKAKDLQFITSQFKRMQGKELRNRLRFYSQQWRTWAACFIQAAWKRFRRTNNRFNHDNASIGDDAVQEIQEGDNQGCLGFAFDNTGYVDMDVFVPRPDAGIEVYAARLLADRSVSERIGKHIHYL